MMQRLLEHPEKGTNYTEGCFTSMVSCRTPILAQCPCDNG